MAEYSYQLKIPKERIAVLIGKKGTVKKQLEDYSKIRIDVDSHEGDVNVIGDDSVKLFSMKEVILAIGRGFNPNVAQLLFKQDYALEVISMLDYAHSKSDLPRVKGRVIGTEGKCRMTIEQLTECYISVYGKTICIIGNLDSVGNAKRAIEMILEGNTHANVYHWLEKRRRELRRFGSDDKIEFKEGVIDGRD